jgi:hypothetical protein
MNIELKAKWVDALRSGEFTQQTLEIGAQKHLCCIGVCGVVAGIQQASNDWGSYAVSKLIGLTDEERDTLFKMNDTDQRSFAEIADYIEANL